ncbi:TetR family transcriptional regulator [Dactylosporangium sp. NPDC051541]|uniref:TetR/AcrR family transcriptional regulator n=1 Tax=Dactylosporangium sp. NPDC051541 TaxID=3363977 RepID=UPI0037A67483
MNTPRRRDAQATRQALLDAAGKRFTRLGYERTTLRDIAGDVGVNLALIKRYFGSKEGLLKAALAASPRFGGDGSAAWDRAALVDALSRHLSAAAWPEFEEHPVLMLLRVSGDAQVDSLRRKALEDFSRKVLAATRSNESAPRTNDESAPRGNESADADHETANTDHESANADHKTANADHETAAGGGELLHAQLVVALGVGVAVLRSAVGLQPLSEATADDLHAPLTALVAALLPETTPKTP